MYHRTAAVARHRRSLSRAERGESIERAQTGCWGAARKVLGRGGLSLVALMACASVALAAGPTITRATFTGNTTHLVMTLSGSGFGSPPSGVPCKLCATPYLNIGSDIGCRNDYNLESWSDSKIVVSGLQGNSNDFIFIGVTNPQNNTVGFLGAPIPESLMVWRPKITSVSFTNIGKDLRMTISGTGFGVAPAGVPGKADLSYFSFVDRPFEPTTWQAGYANGGVTSLRDWVTLDYLTWSVTKIEIGGFGGKYGKGPLSAGHWQVAPNDPVEIAVADTNSCGLGIDRQPSPYIPVATWPVWGGYLR
jgi:hypothetical protein